MLHYLLGQANDATQKELKVEEGEDLACKLRWMQLRKNWKSAWRIFFILKDTGSDATQKELKGLS